MQIILKVSRYRMIGGVRRLFSSERRGGLADSRGATCIYGKG